MLARQKVLLDIISKAGDKTSRLSLVKWAFLFSREQPAARTIDFYHFVPYKFGPFSFTLYHELDGLIRGGYVDAPTSEDIVVTTKAQQIHISDTSVQQAVQRLWTTYGARTTAQLIEDVYSRYKWFTLKAEKPERRAVIMPAAAVAIYTIGYEGLHIDSFFNLLLEKGIRKIIDVRNNPVSRRYGFHKVSMSRICQMLEMDYAHVPEVGVPSEWRASLNGPESYQRLFARYNEDVLPSQTVHVQQVASLLKTSPSVLLCQEADPNFCHRSHLARAIAPLTGLPTINFRTK